MTKIIMVTEFKKNSPNGSVNRPKWEIEALQRKGFTNIELVDEFNKTKINQISDDSLIHAQQLSGRLLKKSKYIVDVHGLEYLHSSWLSKGYSFSSWRHWSFIAKKYFYKKLEHKIFRNSKHIICAGERIFDIVKDIQTATVVRNSVFLEKYKPCSSFLDFTKFSFVVSMGIIYGVIFVVPPLKKLTSEPGKIIVSGLFL